MNPPDRALPLWVRLKLMTTRAVLSTLARTIGLGGLYHLLRGFAYLEWLVDVRRRRRFGAFMRRVGTTDRAEIRRATRAFFVRTRCDKVFYLIFDRLPRATIMRHIHFPDRARIDASLERGRGVYVALSHLGAQHIAGLAMCFLGYATAGVRDRHEGPLRRYIQAQYARRFDELRAVRIFFSDSFPRDIYRCLRDNYVLGSALDVERQRDPHLKRADVQIFGEQRAYLTGTLQIALRCGAAIHQGFVISRPGFHYDLIATAPLCDPDHAKDEPEQLQRLMQTYASHIEAFAREHPDHISRLSAPRA